MPTPQGSDMSLMMECSPWGKAFFSPFLSLQVLPENTLA